MGDLNFFTMASLILGTLKLLGFIDWPWLWVLAPAGFVIGCQLAVTLWIAGRGLLVSRNEEW